MRAQHKKVRLMRCALCSVTGDALHCKQRGKFGLWMSLASIMRAVTGKCQLLIRCLGVVGMAINLASVLDSCSKPSLLLHDLMFSCSSCFLQAQVSAYLASPQFKARVAARKARGQRGIIINAGGPNLISSTIVTLKVTQVTTAWLTAAVMACITAATLLLSCYLQLSYAATVPAFVYAAHSVLHHDLQEQPYVTCNMLHVDFWCYFVRCCGRCSTAACRWSWCGTQQQRWMQPRWRQ
jgi:hypothetical protein